MCVCECVYVCLCVLCAVCVCVCVCICLMPSDEDLENVIPHERLVAMCKYEPVKEWMRTCDHILYQALVEILIPDVLRPVPSESTPSAQLPLHNT